MLPEIAAPRSVRMSPKRFEATTTSRLSGRETKRALSESISCCACAISGYAGATGRKTSCQKTILYCMLLDLVALVTFFCADCRAYLNVYGMHRSVRFLVLMSD